MHVLRETVQGITIGMILLIPVMLDAANPEDYERLWKSGVCRRCNLEGIDLQGAQLKGVNLGGANLRNADLSMTNLEQANLGGADLRGANLRGANLTGTTFCKTTMPGGELNNASCD